MSNNKVDILAFAAHPDDIELSAAGTLMKHIAQGKKVAIVDLTQGELGSRGTIQTRYEEAAAASEIMGVHFRENVKMEDGFFEINEANKRKIIEQVRRFQPEIVLANAVTDRHPDHGRAGQLVSEACFLSGLLKIETEWEGKKQEKHRPNAVYHYIQDYYLNPDFVVDISEFYDRKMEAILAYRTQFFDPESTEPETPISGKDFMEFITSRMRQYGRPVGVQYAEGFTAERFIGVDDLFDLK
ncbi:MAG: bacillithiol biosynthesis deacetylase BshB1 [Flavobacteriales bacterium]|nr:bacillithiol biosynthesis deacetylase BshB1 [Flavobacteriales bacterium]